MLLALHGSLDARTACRIGVALGLSIALHCAVIGLIRAGPPRVSHARGAIIEARIEHVEVALPKEIAPNPDVPRKPVPQATGEQPHPPSASAETGRTSVDPELAPVRQTAAAANEVPLTRDPTYYAIAYLDRPPVPLAKPDVCYPQGANGNVAYDLLIDEEGYVDQATVVAVKPVGLFTAAAAELCRAIRFAPAVREGRAVRSRVRFVVGPA